MGTPDRLFGQGKVTQEKEGDKAGRGLGRTLTKFVGVGGVLASFEGLVLFTIAIALALSLAGAGAVAAVTINPGDFLVTDGSKKAVIQVDPTTGAQTLVSSDDLFVTPLGLAIEVSGSIVVVDNAASGMGAVIRVDPTTGVQTLVSSGGFFASPQGGIAVNASGDILVTTPGASRGVIRVNPTTGVQTPVSTGGLFVFPIGLAIEASALSR